MEVCAGNEIEVITVHEMEVCSVHEMEVCPVHEMDQRLRDWMYTSLNLVLRNIHLWDLRQTYLS